MTEAQCMQSMGHTDPQIFRRHYLNQIITADTLACFLSAPSREGIMRLVGHMSLTRDPSAPNALSQAQKDELHSHPLAPGGSRRAAPSPKGAFVETRQQAEISQAC